MKSAAHIIFTLAREYFYFIYRFFFSISHRTPRRWSIGSRGEIVFVPGFGARATYYWELCEYLNQQGYKVITVPALGQSLRKVASEARIVVRALTNMNHTKNVVFVAHSKGGITVKYILDHHPEIQVKKCITLGAPFGGTYLSCLSVYHLDELMPRSSLIQKIQKININNHLIHQIVPRIDNHVIPYTSLLLTGAQIHKTSVVGHTLLSQEPEALKKVVELLELG